MKNGELEMPIQIVEGNLVKMECDAIATLLNPEGEWYGAVDKAIMAVSGEHYYKPVRKLLADRKFANGDCIPVLGDKSKHHGGFNHVIFACDDVFRPKPIYHLVGKILSITAIMGLKSIALPVFRTGAACRFFPNQDENLHHIMFASKEFMKSRPDITVKFVVYNDPALKEILESLL